MAHFGRGGTPAAGNNSIIVGETGDPSVSDYIPRVTLWDANGTNPRVVTGLGDLAGRAAAVNSFGVYVGAANPPQGPFLGRGFMGQAGTAEFMSYPGYDITHGVDINDSNWIVGVWRDGTAGRGYLARAFDTEIHDLGTLPGVGATFPRALNDAGEIVGVSADRAAYWPSGATSPTDFNLMVDMHDTLVEAMDINNAGQILARGFNGYYIFTPVPEPLVATGLACGWVMVARRGREKRRTGSPSEPSPGGASSVTACL